MFLILTPLKEFWKRDAELLALGTWCDPHQKEKQIVQTVPCVWEDLDKLEESIGFTQSLYDDVLDELVECLNSHHQVTKDRQYWNILLSSWLLPFIQIVYDKYVHVCEARKKHEVLMTYTLSPSDYYTPRDFNEFASLVAFSDLYHLQLSSYISEWLGVKALHRNASKPMERYNKLVKRSYKENLFTFVTKTLNSLFSKKSVMMVQPHIKGIFSMLTLVLKSRFLVVFDNLLYDTHLQRSVDKEVRGRVFAHTHKGFKALLFDMFSHNFPTLFLEQYTPFILHVKGLSLRIPDAVLTSVGLHGNNVLKFLVAEYGLKVLSKQHGGGYGTELLLTNEKIERSMSYLFYTSGWSEDEKTKPLSSPHVITMKSTPKEATVNLIMTEMPMYIYRLQFAEDSTKMVAYMKNTERFIEAFHPQEQLLIRLHPNSFGWELKEKLTERFVKLNFDSKTPFYTYLSTACINIFDHMHTGYLESLSMNKPTLIFIPPNIYRFRKSALPFIERLKEVKILFEDALEASHFAQSILGNVDAWWLSSEVQKAKNAFCERYAKSSDKWIDEWVDELNRIVNT